MQLTARYSLVSGLLALAFSPAGAVELADQRVTYSFRNFNDADDVHVQSHVGRYAADLGGKATVYLHWNHETVTVPGISAAAGTQEAVDAITTASRPISSGFDAFQDFAKVRNELQGDLAFKRVRVGYYLSTESDYFAQQIKASFNRDFFDQNLNLTVGTSYGWDAIKPLEDDDSATGNESRTTWNWNAVVTQILSPTTVLRVGGELYRVKGLQHSPYRNVYAGGGPRPEVHPETRWRRDAFVKVDKYLKNRSGIQMSYVGYQDDWGVVSHSLGGRLSQYISEDVLVRYRYRYYTQGAADFFREEYADSSGIDGYRTADYRLGEFGSHLFGVHLDFNLGGLADRPLLRRMHLELKYERYFNSNNFSANIFESGLSYRF